MKTYFTDILEKGENGLYLCQMPTGSGKTYSVVEAIKDYVKSLTGNIKGMKIGRSSR